MEHISDMKNYIRSRQDKGKTQTQIREDLEKAGYDRYAARGLVLLHWQRECEHGFLDGVSCPECANDHHISITL